jgi:hypothetical protein
MGDPFSANYLGMGTDRALAAPRSAIQIVSPTGSTPVGVMSPSLITVTLALSPVTVRAEILPLALRLKSGFARDDAILESSN